MHLIVYTSKFLGNPDNIKIDLSEITESAKRNNPTMGITGVLFYHSERFLQIIEGEQPQLESLMDKLSHDTRHDEIERLIDSPILKRGFDQWNMDSFDLSDEQHLALNELQTIAKVYKHNIQADSKLISDFYRVMIKQQNLS